MPAIKITGFGGMIPAVDDRLVPDNHATYAENTWVYDGSISGLKALRYIRPLQNPNAKRVFRIPLDPFEKTNFNNSLWLEFTDGGTDFLRGPVREDAFQRYYWTGPSTVPSYNPLSRIQTNQLALRLGVPAPANAPGVDAPVTAPDTTAPVATSANIYGAMIVIEFEEERWLDPFSVPPASAFTVTANDTIFQVFQVSVDQYNTKVTLTLVNPVPPNSTVTVAYQQPGDNVAIKDNSGNLAPSFTLTVSAANNETLDLAGPVFGWADCTADKIWVTFIDDSALAANTPPPSSWLVIVNGESRNVTAVEIFQSLKAFGLQLAFSTAPGDTIRLGYARPADQFAVQDIFGNKASGFTGQSVRNNTTSEDVVDASGPLIQSAYVQYNSLSLVFDRALDVGSVPATNRFTVNANFVAVPVTAVAVDGRNNRVVLSLNRSISWDETTTVSYTDPTGDQTTGIIQSTTGADAPSFSNFSVENRTPYEAPANNDPEF
jgi:uncharacterized repeat protein (TIGR02059 family)